MGCGFCAVATVRPSAFFLIRQMHQHLSKSVKILSLGVLGPFWVVGLAKNGFRTPARESAIDVFNILSRKAVPFWREIQKIENGIETAQGRQDRHRDPLKTIPESSLNNT